MVITSGFLLQLWTLEINYCKGKVQYGQSHTTAGTLTLLQTCWNSWDLYKTEHGEQKWKQHAALVGLAKHSSGSSWKEGCGCVEAALCAGFSPCRQLQHLSVCSQVGGWHPAAFPRAQSSCLCPNPILPIPPHLETTVPASHFFLAEVLIW